jgi:arabinogalactan oligomer/maltooligosaccharide transport system substrate-binding protein
MKKFLALLLALAMIFALVACGGTADTEKTDDEGKTEEGKTEEGKAEEGKTEEGKTEEGKTEEGKTEEAEVIKLTVWVGDNYPAVTEKMVESFKEENEDIYGVTFDITIGIQPEGTVKDTVLNDPEAAADVFTFADDQLFELVAAGALEPLGDYDAEVREANGAGAISLATVGGTLYAFPMNVSNGYFLYYNKEFLNEEDVQTLDKILEVAEANGKFFAFDMPNAWYLYSFFKGAGLEVVSPDGKTNESCNWNATDTTPTGAEVYEALLAITGSKGFKSLGDADTVAAIKDGSVIAAVNGPWNANAVQEALGDNYGCAKLPTYTVAGNQYQMASFAGGKLIGVSSYSQNKIYALMLADWLTNEENQLLRFQELGDGPSNVNLVTMPEVLANPAIAALSAQAPFAVKQVVGGNYWGPAGSLGQNAVDGVKDNIQDLLDTCVEGILG